MSDTTYPPEAWARLGLKARQRRISLGLSQPEVSAAGGPSTGVISKIENAKQTTYEDRVLVQLERALKWQPGSAARVLSGGEPRPIDELRGETQGGAGELSAADEEQDSPITPQLRALLEQAQRRTDDRLAELTEKVERSNELIRKLLEEQRGA
ncbi:hypothetical protein FH608_046580 [Nonomuraea phyllanthi]|uniref:Helix-turn-helix domain-containing protein n=1 Tax=Nonomuraea phyllanthi TaxID=2219224 RepID=A0A5C4V6D7_9ACTN|nr:helix-turn-helix domain-containing protein [Nonomuraea phyllanthi]KAB8186960.1 hypothetical protein FH608_046580 [Nonomuraea phyllanthi]